MLGIKSVITLEDRFSGTLGLLVKGVRGTLGPADLMQHGLGNIAGTGLALADKLGVLYQRFDTFKGILGIASSGLTGITGKFGNMSDMISKVASVFPVLSPIAMILTNISGRAKDGASLFDQLANVVVDLQLPFSGLVKTFLSIKAFLQGIGGKLLKGIAIIAAIAVAIKSVLTVGMFMERNLPKAFKAVGESLVSIPGKLKKLDASLLLSDGPYAKYRNAVVNTFGKVKSVLKPAGDYMKVYAGVAKFHLDRLRNEWGWYVLGARVKLWYLKEDIKESSAYKKATAALSEFTEKAKGRWIWYSGIAKSHLHKVTEAVKATKAYQILSYKYNWYMGQLRKTEGYQKAMAMFSTFITSAKANLIKLGIAIKTTALAQASLFKSMVLKHGLFGGISKYIGYVIFMSKEFVITKLLAIKAFLAMRLEAIKTFLITLITSSSLFKTLKNGILTVFNMAKTLWGRLPGIIKAAFAGYAIYKAIKGIITAFNSLGAMLDSWKEKVDELVEKTSVMEKATRRSMEMGEGVSKAFTRMATKLSISTGIAKNDILEFNTALHRVGVGNATNQALTDLAARFSVLNDSMDFNSVSGALAEAIRSGSADGLAQLMHDNPLAKIKMQKMHLDRMLSKGDIDGFIKSFSAIADEFGYTQSKADELTNTTQGKLKRIGANIDRLSEKVKSTFISRLEPYINKFLDFIQSPEFQQQFDQITRRFSAMLDMAGSLIESVVDFGISVYKWWIEPTGGALRNIMLFLATAKGIGWVITLLKGFAFLTPIFAKVFGVAKLGMIGFGKAIKAGYGAYKKFKEGGVTSLFKRNMKDKESAVKRFGRTVKNVAAGAAKAMKKIALAPGYVFAALFLFIGKGCQKLVESITGEAKGVVESVIDVVVGGTVTTFGYVKNEFAKFINGIVSAFESGINFMIGLVENVANALVEGFFWAKNKINKLFGEDEEEVVPLVRLNRVEFGKIDVDSDDKIHERAENAVKSVMDVMPGILSMANEAMDIMGLNDDYGKEWDDLMNGRDDKLDDTNDKLGKIKRNTDAMRQKMDLQWMKELAEQRFVNNVNLRQLTPTINVKVTGTKSTPEDISNRLAAELEQMSDANAFYAYGARA